MPACRHDRLLAGLLAKLVGGLGSRHLRIDQSVVRAGIDAVQPFAEILDPLAGTRRKSHQQQHRYILHKCDPRSKSAHPTYADSFPRVRVQILRRASRQSVDARASPARCAHIVVPTRQMKWRRHVNLAVMNKSLGTNAATPFRRRYRRNISAASCGKATRGIAWMNYPPRVR
jgi:hypothetical protein